jgi:signal recognition particle GTPase
VKNQVNDKEVKRMIAIINSMTRRSAAPGPAQRLARARIARGSGTSRPTSTLLKQFQQMEKMMSQAVRRRHEGHDARHEGHAGRPRAGWHAPAAERRIGRGAPPV